MFVVKNSKGKEKSYRKFRDAIKKFIKMTKCFTKITEEILEDIDRLISGKCEIYFRK